jgi:cytochrome subunit of sulfide dehydrogenase
MTTRCTFVALVLALSSVHAGATVQAPSGVAACSGCHPRNGGPNGETGLPPLAGRNANDIVAAMNAFRSGKRPATVMDRIAKGFTADETAAIAAWYAAQK